MNGGRAAPRSTLDPSGRAAPEPPRAVGAFIGGVDGSHHA